MPNSQEARPATPRRWHQFSLLSLILFSLAFGVVCAGIFNPYNVVRFVTLLAVQGFLFYVYLTWWIYARGYLRTFGIGAAMSFVFPWVATGILWIYMPFTLLDPNMLQRLSISITGTDFIESGMTFLWPSVLAAILFIDSVFTGGTMVFARWLIDRARRKAGETAPAADSGANPFGTAAAVVADAVDASAG